MAHRAVRCRCNVCEHKWEAVIDEAEANPKLACPKCRKGTRQSTEILPDEPATESPTTIIENDVLKRKAVAEPPDSAPDGMVIMACDPCGFKWKVKPEGVCGVSCPRCRAPMLPERAPDSAEQSDEYVKAVVLTTRRYNELFHEFVRVNVQAGPVNKLLTAAVEIDVPYLDRQARAVVASNMMICDRLDALLELMQEPEQPVLDPQEQKTLAIAREQERRRLASEAASSTNTG